MSEHENLSDVPRHLLNTDGSCFGDLAAVGSLLQALENPYRISYRNSNAKMIASTEAPRVLIVSGPGSGKSHLFMSRIEHWLERGGEKVYVATFVRKLVKDLQADVKQRVPRKEQARVDVNTLHTLARSLLERSGGTESQPMRPHIRIVDSFWADVVWMDIMAFHPDLGEGAYALSALETQFYTEDLIQEKEWTHLRATHGRISQFYNAVGFAYLVYFTREAVEEQPELNRHALWIIDEYQDFNAAEDHLIRTLVKTADGVLLAGDDEQALYQRLKAATPEIIVGHYNDPTFAKAMLPYCSRCGYHICIAASEFIRRHRGNEAIDKLFLPLQVAPDDPPVRLVATAHPASAVDYVRTFLKDREGEFAEYTKAREAGRETDPFLLILSQSGLLTNSKVSPQDRELEALVAPYGEEPSRHSADYLRVATYYGAGVRDDNFAIRKVLYFEEIDVNQIHEMVEEAMAGNGRLADTVRRHLPGISDRILRVQQLIASAANDADGTAQDLADLLDLDDPPALAAELADAPIGRDVADKQDDEAIETAGAIAPVALMTMVGSKGLSAHHVIIVGCDDTNMGFTTPLTFFVAMTRARRSLHIVASCKAGGSKGPHQFLGDLPKGCCEYLTYKKTGRVETRLSGPNAFAERFTTWMSAAARGTQTRR